MSKYLTEKNLMWAAIAVLAFFAYDSRDNGRADHDAGMRERMSQMRNRMGSMGDLGKGAWIKEKKDGVKEGRKKAPKDAK